MSKKKTFRSPHEELLRRKVKAIENAYNAYWKKYDQLAEAHWPVYESVLDIKRNHVLSSIVWGLEDGACLIRYQSFTPQPKHEIRICPMTLAEWFQSGLFVPTPKGDYSLAQSRTFVGFGFELFNCQANDVYFPYLHVSHIRYGEAHSSPTLEMALVDFQMTIMGILAQRSMLPGTPDVMKSGDTVNRLNSIANEFANLLNAPGKEEQLQTFMKSHPMVLHHTADVIPKQKLGENFVTDFVLVHASSIGPVYTLVEIERADDEILCGDDNRESQKLNHAQSQVRDWKLWLEENQGYLRNRLPNFESPEYWIIIGRSGSLSDTRKALIRTINRDSKSVKIKTYDDLLIDFRKVIDLYDASIYQNQNPVKSVNRV